MSSTHTLPVNIFNLEGEEIMLARDNENETRIELTTLNRSVASSILARGMEISFVRAWFLLLPS